MFYFNTELRLNINYIANTDRERERERERDKCVILIGHTVLYTEDNTATYDDQQALAKTSRRGVQATMRASAARSRPG